MRKQHFTTEVACLVNPPLLSKYEALQKEIFEKVYASKKTPLGRTLHPTVPPKAIKQGFGIITEKGDSAGVLLYPFSCRIFHSVYNDSFKPPNGTNYSDIPAAGVKTEGTDESGTRMKRVFEEIGNVEPTVIAPLTALQQKNMKNKELANKELGGDLFDTESNRGLASSNQAETCLYLDNLLFALWNLVKNKKSCYRKHFYSYLKSYLQVSKQLSWSFICSKDRERNLLIQCRRKISDKKYAKNICKTKNVIPPYALTTEQLTSSASVVGNHKRSVPSKTAGLPSCRNDIAKPKLRSVMDYNEYGDTKSLASVVQPSVFEKYGVYEDDLGTLRTKEEIKSILIQSGICFNNEVFNVIWEKVKKKGKASIGEIWSGLKYICLTQNDLFP